MEVINYKADCSCVYFVTVHLVISLVNTEVHSK